MKHWLYTLLAGAALVSPLADALAQALPEERFSADMQRLDAMLPNDTKLQSLETAMRQNPELLDNYFDYAQTSAQLGRYEQAAQAYEHMIQKDPSLDRVKLDLSLMYMQLQRFDEARSLLQEVRTKDIPERVRQNIDLALARIDEASKQHYFNGSITVGINFDTNGNSAPDEGLVRVFDTLATLTGDGQPKEDWQLFSTATLNHRYRFGGSKSWEWQSSGTYYQTEQDTLDTLDLKILSLQTGPVYRFNEGKSSADLTAGYTHIILDTHTYLRLYATEVGLEHILSPRLRTRTSFRQEFRDFVNAPGVTTFEERRGHARQMRLSFFYSLTERDLLDLHFTVRDEQASAEYYSNRQLQPQIGFTHQWDDGYFGRAQASYRDSDYEESDLFISSRVRRDKEKSAGLLLGKNFEHNLSLTVGYDYRDVDSNIENYSYDNHRFSTALNWRF